MSRLPSGAILENARSMIKDMEHKLEGSSPQAESCLLNRQEFSLEHGDEELAFESFQLLQIDTEVESARTLQMDGEMWCSKNVLRKQRHWEKIVAAKKSKRKQERERRKAQRTENAGMSPQQSKRVLKAMTKERLLAAKSSGPKICIDLSMTDRMTKKELSRLAAQIRRLYGSNKKAKKPFWICLTGFATDSPLYEECLRMNDGFSNYLMDTTEEDYLDLFPLESLVYLTPDSEHALEDIDLDKVYIIGGLVDESIQKKLTYQKAQENLIQTARLPIQEYMVKNANAKNYHSEILAINQVFDILSTYVETQNWPEALKTGVSLGKGYVIPNTVE
ncbi:tRNA methyltransferase 10 homolog B isoform X2 [Antechinus flavipes]|uniref:tRNA methyltransferase 10 homolog B isoform X2 n=1 Tax=Antechinus flavipes TaxID=38775 RepID=UPI002236AE30|nr:tRNA methyltransferase 10 homolog B isoform X2 [Antechinus flavipes]